VVFLVKPEREPRVRAGLRLWRVRRFGRPIETTLRPHEVFCEATLPRDRRWDTVLLCVDATALRAGLLPGLAAAVGQATVASIGQAAGDAALLAQAFPAEQIVAVVPSMLAWDGPLASETPGPGVTYWLPPLSSLAVGGPRDRAMPLVAALRRGKLRAHHAPAAAASGARFAALTMPYLAALELAGWSLTALRRSAALELAARAASQATSAVATMPARTSGGRAWLARLALRALPHLVPFDLERYLARHFTKVGRQTLLMLQEWAALGRQRGRDVSAVERLAAALEDAR